MPKQHNLYEQTLLNRLKAIRNDPKITTSFVEDKSLSEEERKLARRAELRRRLQQSLNVVKCFKSTLPSKEEPEILRQEIKQENHINPFDISQFEDDDEEPGKQIFKASEILVPENKVNRVI